ncbi:MAG: MBL fold metallo-hydrolase [Kiritimatiellae bacterium]|nr:MBL fold metallo-hydrolase [Kiritimatiellia bacterium]
MPSKILHLFLTISLLAVSTVAGKDFEMDTLQTSQGDLKITFIGHGTLMFEWSGKIIHVDPWTQLADYAPLPKADLILITHEHRDHLDPKAIETLKKPGTQVVANPTAGMQVQNAVILRNGESRTLQGVPIQAVPAYNILHMRQNNVPFHPKGFGNGYVLTFADKRVYVAGDTENIPEMKNLGKIDCAFLPMNLPYTMTPEMVADAAHIIKPAILYPYHFGETDTARLTALLKDSGIDVRIRQMK